MKSTDAQKRQTGSTARSSQPFFGTEPAQAFFTPGQAVQRKPFFKPSGTGPAVQAKLTVGAAGDQYEQEADRVAAAVVDQIHSPAPEPAGEQQAVQRMSEEEELQAKPLQRMEEEDELQMSPLTKPIQRMGEEEDELQMKPLQRETMEEDELQMMPLVQRVGAEGGEVSADFERELNAARGGGQSLAPDLQAKMGEAMGADFGGVRVHTDGRADELNQSVGARAFTTGQDLFFKRGEYQPGSQPGQELIAHELTHVVQQNGGAVQRSQSLKDGSNNKVPRFIRTATVTSKGMIQCFNAMQDNPYTPTKDIQHPALANIAGFAGPMGPYTFRPMQGDFQYNPPSIAQNGVERFLRKVLLHKKPGPQYGPENIAPVAGGFIWPSPKTGANITFHPGGLKVANPVNRVNIATNLYNTEKDNARIPGHVIDQMKAHAGAANPRPFVSVAAEDAWGAAANAHTMDRHVIGGGPSIPDADAVAARALFGKLGGMAGAVAGVYTPIATAFNTAADADAEVAAVINGPFTAKWNQYREELVTQGIVNMIVPRIGRPVTAYRSASNAKVPAKYVPAYLPGGVAATGRLPLYNLDPRWTNWANAQKISPAAQANMANHALAVDESANVPNINVRILSSDALGPHGWFVHSAYPTQ